MQKTFYIAYDSKIMGKDADGHTIFSARQQTKVYDLNQPSELKQFVAKLVELNLEGYRTRANLAIERESLDVDLAELFKQSSARLYTSLACIKQNVLWNSRDNGLLSVHNFLASLLNVGEDNTSFEQKYSPLKTSEEIY